MTEQIENDLLRIEIASDGAELKSIYNKNHHKEYLWQGSPDWWPRRAPVLFPIVGKLNNNAYRVNGKVYSLPQHGFARDNPFVVTDCSALIVEFALKSNPEFLQKYPFHFELKIRYSLDGARLHVLYEVYNKDSQVMYFSIGAHPGLALQPGETLSDYDIEFEKPETLDRHLLDQGLFNGKTERVLTRENILSLNSDLFKKDAIVFKQMKSKKLVLKSRKSDYHVTVSYDDFPYFGIWSKPGASFLCLEPWCGLADNQGFEGELKDKQGIETLKPGLVFTRTFSIEL